MDARKLKQIAAAGKYTSNANLVGITKKVFMTDSEAVSLVASGNIDRKDVILAYNQDQQKLSKYNHDTTQFDALGGSGFVQTYTSIANMLAAQNSDAHEEGSLYRVTTTAGHSYYEMNTSTKTGTLDDYNIVSRKTTFDYPDEASLLADQGSQVTNQWYHVPSTYSIYMFKGTATGSLGDYVKVGGYSVADREKHLMYKNQIVRPEDCTLYYENIDQAISDGVLSGSSIAGQQTWNLLRICRTSQYWDIIVPPNTSIVWVRWINDRLTNYVTKYLDGDGQWFHSDGHGVYNQQMFPGPFGLAVPSNANAYHRWHAIPVSKTSRSRTIRIYDEKDDPYISGLAFSSENPWEWTCTGALELHRAYFAQKSPDPLFVQNGLGWNSQNNSNDQLAELGANSTAHFAVTALSKNDQILYFTTHPAPQNWGYNPQIRINGQYLDSDLVTPTGGGISGYQTGGHGDNYRWLTAGWDNPIAHMAAADNLSSNGFVAIRVPGKYINIDYDSDGIAIPTAQAITIRNPSSSSSFYARSAGFMRATLEETGVSIGNGTYNPTTSTDWAGTAPTTVDAAIDRLAALIKTLNSGTGA